MQDTNGNIMGLANLTGLLVEKVRYTESGEAVFEYDHVPPQVDVARVSSGNLRIRFSEPIDQTKATSAIKILDGANPIAGSITFDDEDRLAIFTPTSPLPQAITLTLKITIDLEDTSSNTLTDEFNHTFSYQGADLSIYDRLAPEVERAEYASGDFSITLTEEYDSTSLANSVEIISATQTIGGTITADGPRKLSFSPSQSLQNETEFTLKVKTSLKDLAGKSLIEFTNVFIFDNTDHLLFEKPNQKEHGESYVKNTTLFQGREYDPETGLYYFRARYYAPKLSMFIQPDPKEYIDSMNPYQAMGNNPINFIDPMGTDLTGRISRESFAAYLVKTKGFEEAQKWIYQQRQIEALGISTALEVYNMPILLGDKIAFDLGITKREGQFSKIANIALIVAPIAGLAWKALGYEGKITQAISGLSNFLKRINTRFGNAGRIGSSKLMNLVRNKLPPLNKFHSIEFDFLKLKTLKKGTRLYRSPFDPTTELVSDPGTWFGTRLTKTKTGTDSMYQLNKVKNALSEMRIYELTEDVTLFYGKVKGGTGYQVKFPSDIDPKEILRYIGKEKLK